jgi:5-methylcytosine-specific restriction endonuclease McrA
LNELQFQYETLILQGFNKLDELLDRQQAIREKAAELHPEPETFFLIPLGDRDKIAAKREAFVKSQWPSTQPLKQEIAAIHSKMLSKVKNQYNVLDEVLPPRVRKINGFKPDDGRFFPDLKTLAENGYRSELPEWWKRRQAEIGSLCKSGYQTPVRHYLFALQSAVLVIPRIVHEKEKEKAKNAARKKKKERSATLAAYESKSRNVGQTLMSEMKKTLRFPYLCPYCGKSTDKTDIHVDHINPVSNGGLSVERNLIPVCASCNLAKRDSSLRRFCKAQGFDFEAVCDRLEAMDKFV